MRPHLDHGDIIYHIPAKVCEFNGSVILTSLMEKLESVRHSAVRVITGTRRGTSREKLHVELGWEPLRGRGGLASRATRLRPEGSKSARVPLGPFYVLRQSILYEFYDSGKATS